MVYGPNVSTTLRLWGTFIYGEEAEAVKITGHSTLSYGRSLLSPSGKKKGANNNNGERVFWGLEWLESAWVGLGRPGSAWVGMGRNPT